MTACRRVFVLSIMDSLFRGGIFTANSFWWVGCGGPKSFMQEHYIMYILIKQSKQLIKTEDIVSFFPLWDLVSSCLLL